MSKQDCEDNVHLFEEMQIHKQPAADTADPGLIPTVIPASRPSIEQLPGGLYFEVDHNEPVCMFADGKDVITVKLSRENARFIGEWLLKASV